MSSTRRSGSLLLTLVRIASYALGAIVIALALAWAGLALWFDGPASRPIAGALAVGFLIVAVVLLLAVRPFRRALTLLALAWLLVLAWWLSIAPRGDRHWAAPVARPPEAEFHGDLVTIRNLRNFDYRSETDFTPRWEERTFDLSKVEGVDLFLSFWGPTLIAHTIMSWDFSDGQHLAISIETRPEEGESYSAVRGFFRQYEVYYVAADERDLVRLRTNYRGETVYLYRLQGKPARARALLMAYLEEINRLAKQPQWYNALTHNCTTTIRVHVAESGSIGAWDWRLLANGKGDELLYERGLINQDLPFAELRARSNITAKAKAADQSPDFSALIREGLPPRPPPPSAPPVR